MNLSHLKSPIAIIVLSGILGSGIFGVQTISLTSQSESLKMKVIDGTKELSETKTNGAEKEASGIDASATRSRTFSIFTSQLQQVTAKAGVSISQLQFETTQKPLMTTLPPRSDAPGKARTGVVTGWGTSNASFVLEGTTAQIYSALKAMEAIETPFSISKILFAKAAVTQSTTSNSVPGALPSASATPASVVANVNVALLTPMGGI